ncbi:MAG TPA: permease [Anaerohalosphaeraceae bacterium]|nr:permease [Anaerohalosphaeraceae bacterium]HOL88865.1 permease [Anaerohalosphaeraceae bacterium]HPP55707.1 permease [Anaerohalosphaeraceae bacterium]
MSFLKQEWKKLVGIIGVFLACFYLPLGWPRFDNAVFESLHLVKWYAREHVLLCLVPAFFIAGAITVFLSQASVMKYLGARANKVLAYGVASVSGTILAVCSCTVLPLFAGIYRMGAGLGPACAFLYSGPAINILAIILTARILGLELGIARAVGAVLFSILIGLIMHFLYRKEELQKADAQMMMPPPQVSRPLRQNVILMGLMIGILVFANWARSGDVRAVFLCCPGGLTTYTMEGTIVRQTEQQVLLKDRTGTEHIIPAEQIQQVSPVEKNVLYEAIYKIRWGLTIGLLVLLIGLVLLWIDKEERIHWLQSTWGYAVQILPLLLFGVLIAGFLLGRVGHEGLIPSVWIQKAVGGNSVWANLFASVAGAFMYFATLTEVPILQGLIGAGMGKGPALALLLAGPALSLPNMLVIRSIMGTQKTVVFVSLVIGMAALCGMIFGAFF